MTMQLRKTFIILVVLITHSGFSNEIKNTPKTEVSSLIRMGNKPSVVGAFLINMEKSYLVYILRDPRDNAIRYVGQTTRGLRIRLNQHISSKKYANNHRENWIFSLLKLKLKPTIHLVEVCNNIDECNEAEMFWIKTLKQIGWKLTNNGEGGGNNLGRSGWNKGGKGPTRSVMAKFITSEKCRGINNPMKGKKHTDEVKKKLSEYSKRPEQIAKSIANLSVVNNSSQLFLNPRFSGGKHSQEVRDRIAKSVSETKQRIKQEKLNKQNGI